MRYLDEVRAAEVAHNLVQMRFELLKLADELAAFEKIEDYLVTASGNLEQAVRQIQRHASVNRTRKVARKRRINWHPKNIPLFRADPMHPDILIRELNGRSERGQLVDGEFKPTE